MSTARAAALAYAQRGWHVLPMRFVAHPDGDVIKRPLTKWRKGRTGQKSTTNANVIRGWWRKWPNAGVGIACGPSDLFIIDVDGKDGDDMLARLEAEHGGLPVTLTAKTRRGRHLYFTGNDSLPQTAGKLGVGVDTRGSGGFVVAPPSHDPHSGKTYAWGDETVPVADLPEDWVTALHRLAKGTERAGTAPATRRISTDPATYAARVLEDELDNVRSAPHGERNDTLNRAAYALGRYFGGGYLTEDEVRHGLLSAALAAGLSEAEAVRTINSGLGDGRDEPLTLMVDATSPAGDEAKIEVAVNRLLITEAARDRVAAMRAEAAFHAPISDWTLKDALDKDLPPLTYTIDRLHPTGSNAVITAQYKVGKTTLMLHLARAYADGSKFLGDFEMTPGGGTIAYLNYELTEQMWLDQVRRLEIENPDRVAPLQLRGQRFDLHSPSAFQWLVRWLTDRGCDAMIVDPYGAAAMLQDENSNSEARHWLRGLLDTVKGEAGVTDLWMPAHTGRALVREGDEHARGASELDDWADVRWLYTADNAHGEPGPAHYARYLRAHGRLVDVSERRLAYNLEEAMLYVKDFKSRSATRREAAAAQAVRVCHEQPGLKSTELRTALRGDTKDIVRGIKDAVQRGWLEQRTGARNAKHHHATPKGLQEAGVEP